MLAIIDLISISSVGSKTAELLGLAGRKEVHEVGDAAIELESVITMLQN